MALPKEEQGKATLVLSKMSTDFEQLKERIESTHFFQEVIEFDEKPREFFRELDMFQKNLGNLFFNMFQRIRFTKAFAKLQEEYIHFNLRKYENIYVYCDGDPIGFYLNQKKIYYHAIEDGLNCIHHFDMARFDNRGAFRLKAFFSKYLNLIVIPNGYSKYCIDVEVNQIRGHKYPLKNFKEVPRKELVDRLTKEDEEVLFKAFISQQNKLNQCLGQVAESRKKILLLSDPISTLEVREQIMWDMIKIYEKEGDIFIKPHPRDILDYPVIFKDYFQFDGKIPMEILGFCPNLVFDKVVAIVTEISGITFAKEVVRLGPDFLDQYEAPEIHRQNEFI